jgi:hypothetical protein
LNKNFSPEHDLGLSTKQKVLCMKEIQAEITKIKVKHQSIVSYLVQISFENNFFFYKKICQKTIKKAPHSDLKFLTETNIFRVWRRKKKESKILFDNSGRIRLKITKLFLAINDRISI